MFASALPALASTAPAEAVVEEREEARELEEEAPAPRPRLGISMPSFRESRWQYDLQALQIQAERHGVDILVRFAGNDPKQQNIQMKELVNIGVDVLIVAATDVFAAADGVAYAKKRDIPVICYDRLAEKCDVDVYVAFERFGVGEHMGRFLVEHAPTGNYILLRGPKSDSNADEFYNGAMKYIAPLVRTGDIKVLMEAEVAGWRADVAERFVEETLRKTTDVAAILAPNDDTAGGVVEALARYELAGKVPVTGQDANTGGLDRISRGTQSMTVFKDTTQLAQKTMQIALLMINGEEVVTETVVSNHLKEVPTVYLPVNFVDKDSLYWLLRLPEFR